MGKDAPVEQAACYDLRAADISTYYARFGHRRLPHGALMALSAASAALPPRHIGYMAWLTNVAGVDYFAPHLKQWAQSLGAHIANANVRAGHRRAKYCAAWRDDWGRQACLDGLSLGMFGRNYVVGSHVRAQQFDCRDEDYRKIRDFVGGAVGMAISQFECELRRAVLKYSLGISIA